MAQKLCNAHWETSLEQLSLPRLTREAGKIRISVRTVPHVPEEKWTAEFQNVKSPFCLLFVFTSRVNHLSSTGPFLKPSRVEILQTRTKFAQLDYKGTPPVTQTVHEFFPEVVSLYNPFQHETHDRFLKALLEFLQS
jgi:hypothetical protein